MTKADIINYYAIIRKQNNTIPDEVLDFMKVAAFEKLERMAEDAKKAEWEADADLKKQIEILNRARKAGG